MSCSSDLGDNIVQDATQRGRAALSAKQRRVGSCALRAYSRRLKCTNRGSQPAHAESVTAVTAAGARSRPGQQWRGTQGSQCPHALYAGHGCSVGKRSVTVAPELTEVPATLRPPLTPVAAVSLLGSQRLVVTVAAASYCPCAAAVAARATLLAGDSTRARVLLGRLR